MRRGLLGLPSIGFLRGGRGSRGLARLVWHAIGRAERYDFGRDADRRHGASIVENEDRKDTGDGDGKAGGDGAYRGDDKGRDGDRE